MSLTRDMLEPTRLKRVVRRRAATRVYPTVYRRRSRTPEYNLAHQAERFYARAEELGLGDLRRYYWYHTIDLGQGLITPGTYDYRATVRSFGFPEDMRGMKVLDVGSATGFFAFEFERRGAHVVSVELPSVDDYDKFPFEDGRQTLEKLASMALDQSAYSEATHGEVFDEGSKEAVYEYVVDGPFKICAKVLGSKVERRYSTIYDLSAETLGSDSFDLVFVGDVLVHTLHPLEGLAAMARVCSGTLVVAQDLPEGLGSRPAVLYVGGEELGEEHLTWWMPNQACLSQLLKKLGFKTIEVVGYNRGAMRPGGVYFDRPVVHARK